MQWKLESMDIKNFHAFIMIIHWKMDPEQQCINESVLSDIIHELADQFLG